MVMPVSSVERIQKPVKVSCRGIDKTTYFLYNIVTVLHMRDDPFRHSDY